VGDRKYQTEAAARAGGATWWRAETWPECLYKKLTVDRYFYRARSGSSRPFLQLETDDFGIAKRRLRDILSEVHDLRESGQTARSADFKTLGALATEMTRIVEPSGRDERTRNAYKNHLDRLRKHWEHGNFDTFPAARVDLDLIMDLRDHLKNRCVFVAGRIGPNTRKLNRRKGYSNNIVNQTLWALRVCLDIAVEKRVRVENPFLTKSTLEKKINLPKGQRKPDFPSTETMQMLFAEMRVSDAEAVSAERGQAFLKIRQHYADRAADLAEFLAYTGCRHEEDLGMRVSDIDRNIRGFLFIDGTKSQQAKRDVPIAVSGLRELLA
jgi:integrase